MTPARWLALSIVSVAIAQVAFKLYFNRRQWRILACAIVFFIFVPYTSYNALKGLPLATVYVATAASQLLVVLISLGLLGERYSRSQYLGFLLVLAGMVIYNA